MSKIEESGLRENVSQESISEVIASGKRMEKGLDVKLEMTELIYIKEKYFSTALA